jgi:hypothetical protein
VAQPLLDLLARNAELFVVRRSGAGEIVALLVVLLVLVPLPLVALAVLARRLAPRLGAVHVLGVGALAALGALLALTRLAVADGPAWLAAGLALGGAFAWAYRRYRAVRLLCTYLGLGLVVVPAVFLFELWATKALAGGQAADLHVSGARTPVVFVVFDELSFTALLDERRQIDAVSYPHLAALAREASWFRNAATTSDVTELAVPAILTGRAPERGRLPILRNHPRNLFTALGGDYELWAAEPITQLCPAALNTAEGGARASASELTTLLADLWVVYLHLLLPPRYAGRLPVISDRWRGFGRPLAEADDDDLSMATFRGLRRDRREELRRFLAALDPEEPRALYFLHVMLPHTPWEFLPSGQTYGGETDRVPGLENEVWQDEEAYVVQAYQRYLLQVRFLDRWLGELTARLKSLRLYDRSLIVLTADHGVSFLPGHSRRWLDAANAPDLLPVPLLVKAPHQRQGEVVDRPASTLDLLPTVLDVLGADPPWTFDGRSVFAAQPGPVHRRVVGRYRDHEIDERLHRDKYATLRWKLEIFGAGRAVRPAGTHQELDGVE